MIDMETSKFDLANYLDSEEMIAEYLNTVLEDGDSSDLIIAIGHIAKSIGMTKIAEKTGMSRPSLYKALSDGSKPQFENNESTESHWRTNKREASVCLKKWGGVSYLIFHK